MLVHLSHPQRQVEIKGPKRTKELLRELNLVIEAHLVIRGDELVTEDEMLADADHFWREIAISCQQSALSRGIEVTRSLLSLNADC